MLKWLTKKVYSSLSEVLGAVYKELDSLQPIDTDTVKWTKSLNGMKAHAVVQNSPVAMNQVQEDAVTQAEQVMVKLVNYPSGGELGYSVIITGIEYEELGVSSGVMPVLVSDRTQTLALTQLQDKPVFAVLQEHVSSGQIGRAVISGLTIARVSGLHNTDFNYCQAQVSQATYLTAGPYGAGRIVWRPSGLNYDDIAYCVINLSNRQSDMYHGAFKVGYLNGVLCVYDGATPTSDYAGYISMGNISKHVPKTEIQDIAGDVYVLVTYDPNISDYIVTITRSGTLPDNRSVAYRLATINVWGIIQVHITDNITVTGRWV